MEDCLNLLYFVTTYRRKLMLPHKVLGYNSLHYEFTTLYVGLFPIKSFLVHEMQRSNTQAQVLLSGIDSDGEEISCEHETHDTAFCQG